MFSTLQSIFLQTLSHSISVNVCLLQYTPHITHTTYNTHHTHHTTHPAHNTQHIQHIPHTTYNTPHTQHTTHTTTHITHNKAFCHHFDLGVLSESYVLKAWSPVWCYCEVVGPLGGVSSSGYTGTPAFPSGSQSLEGDQAAFAMHSTRMYYAAR